VEPRGHQPVPAFRGGEATPEEAIDLRPDAPVSLLCPRLVVRQEPRLVGHQVRAVPRQRHGRLACGRQRVLLRVVPRLEQRRRQVPHQDHRAGAPGLVARPLELLESQSAIAAAPQLLPAIAELSSLAVDGAVKDELEDLDDGLLGLGGDGYIGEADKAPLEQAGEQHPDPARMELVELEEGEP